MVERTGPNDGDGFLRRALLFRHSLAGGDPVVMAGGWARPRTHDQGRGSNGPSGWPWVVEVVYCIREPATEIASEETRFQVGLAALWAESVHDPELP